MSLYATDGSFNVVFVDGSTWTGLFNADGHYNVVVSDGSAWTGLMHPCGGYNVVEYTSGAPKLYHECGAFLYSETPFQPGTFKITDNTPEPEEE